MFGIDSIAEQINHIDPIITGINANVSAIAAELTKFHNEFYIFAGVILLINIVQSIQIALLQDQLKKRPR